MMPYLWEIVADEVSIEAANKLVRLFGGQRLSIPKRITKGHQIWVYCGRATAQCLSKHYGGEMLVIPMASRMQRAKLHAKIAIDPRPANVIAQENHMHVMSVYRLRGGKKIDIRQIDLFKKDEC